MPVVPLPDGQQARLGGVPQGRIVAPQIDDTGARQTMAFGGALQELGGAAGRIAADIQAQADEVRITDALNRVKEQALTLQHDKDVGYLSVKGRDAFERADGKPLEVVYGEQLGNTISDLAGGLGNDRQRAAFVKAAGGIAVNFRGGVQEHERREYIGYQASVSEGVISTAQRDIALNWSNPDAVQAAIQRTQGEVYRQAKLMGKSAEWKEATSRKLTSDAHKLAALSALEQRRPDLADEYLKRHAEGMDAFDLFEARKQVDAELSETRGRTAGDVAFAVGVRQTQQAHAAAAPGGSFDRMVQITLHSESRGKRYGPDGKTPLTSPAGAMYEMQVMPSTITAPGFGIKPADPNNPDDVARVGREYLGKMLQRYGGDPAKAWAAYNWGPGAVDKAVKANGADWLASAPKETRDYVAQNMRMLGEGAGSAKPAKFDTLAALQALEANPALARDPKAMQAARQQLEHKARLYDAGVKAQADQVFSGVLQGLIQNGGDFSALPVGQKLALAQADPAKYDDAMQFAKRIGEKQDVQTDPALYQLLTTKPEKLKNLSQDELFNLRTKLSDQDHRHFQREWAKLNGKESGGAAGDLNTGAIKTALDQRLNMLKIDPTPKDGTPEAMRAGVIRKFVADYMAGAQREAGKKFNDAEIGQHLDALFANNVQFRSTFMGVGGSLQSMAMLGMKAKDIPDAEHEAIQKSLKAQGIASPSEAQVLETYWRLRTTSNRPAQTAPAATSASGGAAKPAVPAVAPTPAAAPATAAKASPAPAPAAPSFYSDEAIAQRKARAAEREAGATKAAADAKARKQQEEQAYEARKAAERAAIAKSASNFRAPS